MKLSAFDAIVQILNETSVRYLVVGGLAVNAHGYLRFTMDVDLVLQLSAENILNAFQALAKLGYHPSVSVTAAQFADPAVRQSWRKEKEMVVLKMWSEQYPETPLDLFIDEPFEFDSEYERAFTGDLFADGKVRFASIPALIAMKREAGRPQDLIDIEKLQEIAKFNRA